MLQFKQTDTEAFLILTLNERMTLIEPDILFTFTHVLTKAVVSFTRAYGADQSTHQERYNQFQINPTAVFANQPRGEWHYVISEVDGVELENGKLMLLPGTEYSPVMYNQPTTYAAYNG